MKNIFYFWKKLVQKTKISYKRLLFSTLFSTLCEILVLSSVAYLTKVIQGSIVNEKFTEIVIYNYEFNLMQLASAFLAIVVVSFILKFYVLHAGTKLAFIAGNDLGKKLFKSVLEKDFDEHINRSDKEFLDLMTNKINMLVNGVFRPAFTLLINIILLVAIIVSLVFITSLKFMFLLLLIFVFFGLFFWVTKNTISKNSIVIKNNSEKRTQIILQGLMSIKEIKIYNFYNFFIDEFGENDLKFRLAQAENSFLSVFPKYVLETIVLLCLGFFILFGNPVSILDIIPQIIALGVAFQKLVPAFQGIFQSLNTLYGYKEISDNIRHEMEATNKREGLNHHTNNTSITKIKTSNLTHSYNPATFINFNDVEFKNGFSYRLRGQSGSGKSTFVNLLTGLLTPEAGLIESDNINLDSYQRLSIASYVSQNFIIPSEYLQTCFRLYNPKITDMEIKLLLNLVELSDILKYNSKIGVNGTLLSGGQRQRIGIALSLASERDVFILDEATTGLEPALEINILLKIKERLKDKILIIISHSELLTILVDYEVDISKN